MERNRQEIRYVSKIHFAIARKIAKKIAMDSLLALSLK